MQVRLLKLAMLGWRLMLMLQLMLILELRDGHWGIDLKRFNHISS